MSRCRRQNRQNDIVTLLDTTGNSSQISSKNLHMHHNPHRCYKLELSVPEPKLLVGNTQK